MVVVGKETCVSKEKPLLVVQQDSCLGLRVKVRAPSRVLLSTTSRLIPMVISEDTWQHYLQAGGYRHDNA